MNYRRMGRWGVKVSELGFGTYLNVGDRMDAGLGELLIRKAYDKGINFFDTADCYGTPDQFGAKGQAEEFLGRVLEPYSRESLFLLTKVMFDMGHGPNDKGLSAKHIKESVDNSLKRLRTDYLDMLMCHRPDPDTPVDETIMAMDDLVRSGKILYWGVSEWNVQQLDQASAVIRDYRARPFIANELRYSLITRGSEENGTFESCRSNGMGVLAYGVLGSGILSGKYNTPGSLPIGSRAADSKANGFMMNNLMSDKNLAGAGKFADIASDLGVTPSQLAIAWTLKKDPVASVILGVSNEKQFDESLGALTIELDDESLSRIESVFK